MYKISARERARVSFVGVFQRATTQTTNAAAAPPQPPPLNRNARGARSGTISPLWPDHIVNRLLLVAYLQNHMCLCFVWLVAVIYRLSRYCESFALLISSTALFCIQVNRTFAHTYTISPLLCTRRTQNMCEYVIEFSACSRNVNIVAATVSFEEINSLH